MKIMKYLDIGALIIAMGGVIALTVGLATGYLQETNSFIKITEITLGIFSVIFLSKIILCRLIE